jgi:HD-GYP domain-containing protein (c-di-GMP phosphodiesterase class II)
MNSRISLEHVLASIIKSIDMYNFLLQGHHRRTAIIAYQLGIAFALEPEQLNELVLAASLHDIGALSITERDQLIEMDVENPEPHEIHGADMLEGFRPFDPIAKIIRHHHIRYDDVLSGKVSEDEVPLECYILHLADRIDVLLLKNEGETNQRQIVIDGINDRFGSIFAPMLKGAFQSIAATDDFWDNILETSFYDLLFMSLHSDNYEIEENDIESLALVFARIVDDKSAWTSKHSQTVSALAYRIGQRMELDPEECFELKIAGYLHDIGKIAIPSELLEKPGKLDEEEFKKVKSHAKYSSLILSPITELSNIARWAVNHHEKRNGSGYPLRLRESAFDDKMDIVAYADIFSALAEDRPYRKGMTKHEILSILGEMAPVQLSDHVFRVIHDDIDALYELQKDLTVCKLASC